MQHTIMSMSRLRCVEYASRDHVRQVLHPLLRALWWPVADGRRRPARGTPYSDSDELKNTREFECALDRPFPE